MPEPPIGTRLRGKTALVTGAAQGMGASIVRLFCAEGANVMATDVQGDAVAERVADWRQARHHRLDVGDERQWTAAVDATVEHFGRIDILVNNAAIQRVQPLLETTLADYETVIRVNQIGPFLGMRAVLPAMLRQGAGAIVNICSTAGLGGLRGMAAYVAAKHAVRGMTKVAALEFAGRGIRVNAVCPGLTDTPMVQRGTAEQQARRAQNTPFGRAAHPDEVARLVLFLASDEASYCSGGEYLVDGALCAGPRW